MEQLTNLKSILHSKRANIFYLEKCRVMQKDGRILYLTEEKNESQFWNVPIANTTCLLLGTGTSITQAAMRMLAQAGVLVGFCGGGGTPLFMGNEIEWLVPQSEYRPTEYIQGWLNFWFDERKRLSVAKIFQIARMSFIERVWSSDREVRQEGFQFENSDIKSAVEKTRLQIQNAQTVSDLLQIEALFTKSLYKIAVLLTKYGEFTREREAADLANIFLNHGNYLAYGLGATTLWVLGIPHGFAVMHGKTRRGALVFDVADLIKDSIILPLAFICAREKAREQEFRDQCLIYFTKHRVLEFMFDEVKNIALKTDWDVNGV